MAVATVWYGCIVGAVSKGVTLRIYSKLYYCMISQTSLPQHQENRSRRPQSRRAKRSRARPPVGFAVATRARVQQRNNDHQLL